MRPLKVTETLELLMLFPQIHFSVYFFFILHLLNNSLYAQKVERLYVFCILTDYYYIILTKQVGGSIVKHPQVADVLRKTPAFELHV